MPKLHNLSERLKALQSSNRFERQHTVEVDEKQILEIRDEESRLAKEERSSRRPPPPPPC